MNNIIELSKKHFNYMVKVRRHLHKNPEVSMKEYNTSKFIQNELDNMKIKYHLVGDTGIVAVINGRKKGKTIGLRADIDALCIKELNTNLDYCSINDGVMHGCGHDGHTASLLGVAKMLKDYGDDFAGTIKLIFEPGEEVGGSFEMFRDSGYLDDLNHCLGQHIWSSLPCGKISFQEGARMAAADLFTLKVTGEGAHASEPHKGIDAVVVASSIIMNLQSIISRELSPLDSGVITIGKLTAGQRFNSIADEAILEGNLRSFSPKVRDSYCDMINRVAENTAKAFRAKCEMTNYFRGTPPVFNTKKVADFGRKVVVDLFGQDSLQDLDPLMGGEDFSKFIEQYTGGFLFVGGGFEDESKNFSHHHGHFNFDEKAMIYSSSIHLAYALKYLASEDM